MDHVQELPDAYAGLEPRYRAVCLALAGGTPVDDLPRALGLHPDLVKARIHSIWYMTGYPRGLTRKGMIAELQAWNSSVTI